jgi:transglutaminase-like putative cysteine protease
MDAYLESSEYIDWQYPVVLSKAKELAGLSCADETLAQRCYEIVRDSILHSWDHQKNPVTCKVSDVLIHGSGYCYAKSHLLAALLRAKPDGPSSL